MFGVLVVRDRDGRLGYLQAFSGMLAGRWEVEGFVPPLFDPEVWSAVDVPGEEQIGRLFARAGEHLASPDWAQLRAEGAEQRARHTAQREEQRSRHQARKAARGQRRETVRADPTLTELTRARALESLDNESRRDKAEKRGLEAEQQALGDTLHSRHKRFERRARALERLRHFASRSLMRRLHDLYQVPNAAGATRPLRALFPSGEPPSGAGDCCAPKLLAAAYRAGLTPVALAEFWAGPPPFAGGRNEGAFYPACRAKCAPLLPFMLEGLEVAAPRRFQIAPLEDRVLRVIYEDRWLVVIDKPEGLLSVPAKALSQGSPSGGDLGRADSVWARLRTRHPEAQGPLLVHRLDLDTSGLLLAALDPSTHQTLQRQFLRREVEKRYLACLGGTVRGDHGTIDLALRVDLEDRPRQIHDPVHGLRAQTRWEVLAREETHTRVALYPLTGRTHQLRVHAAHPLGLNAAILGDRLYGHPGTRLLLHAECLSFTHPHSGERLTLRSPPPF
ncbi:MAG: RluA family pseudouridine synthase [Myxococcota bacterium]|nr:RluA family pseudouridine synthase [Myxococcota bacterium]